IGEFEHTIDGKGRLAMPYRFRRELGKGAVITRGDDINLVVYPRAEWEKLAQKLAAIPMANPKGRAFARFMLSGAIEVDFDRQGRALIPQFLREYAGISTEAVVIGMYNKIEVWQGSRWEKLKKTATSSREELLTHLQSLDI
ncbi:division/cell wall cluster transcriptional repressor MraZ, partial [Candidatus Berkelbacteria bacterium]|nr:division/cell wall cluster transcriptional repressor MraZ [Candidatus Berkelbacteria bacterium]